MQRSYAVFYSCADELKFIDRESAIDIYHESLNNKDKWYSYVVSVLDDAKHGAIIFLDSNKSLIIFGEPLAKPVG